MTDQTTDFFDGIGEGTGAPGPRLSNVNDGVIGTIVKMFKRDYVPYENRKTREPERHADGSPKQQLVVVLQTAHRNWENVGRVPKVDPSDENSAEKPPSDDDGTRAIFVPEGKNIQFAIGRAVAAVKDKGPFAVGGTLGVKIFNLKDTGQGNPLKEHEAIYTPPSAGDAFLQSAPATAPAQAAPAPAQPAAAPAQAAPAVDPWANQPTQAAPAATPAPAAAPADPWANQGAPSSAPPF